MQKKECDLDQKLLGLRVLLIDNSFNVHRKIYIHIYVFLCVRMGFFLNKKERYRFHSNNNNDNNSINTEYQELVV